MNPNDIIACLARHGIAFDGLVTIEQIQSHLKTHRETYITHLLAELDRHVFVRLRCGDDPLIVSQPYP